MYNLFFIRDRNPRSLNIKYLSLALIAKKFIKSDGYIIKAMLQLYALGILYGFICK